MDFGLSQLVISLGGYMIDFAAKKNNMQRVFNFSGGKTSAYMVIHYWQPGDLVIFTDTGREHPKTYKFINDFEAFENIPVIRLSYNGGFEKLIEKRKAVPNRTQRFCTIELKIKTCRRYLVSQKIREYESFTGFRFDEPQRVKRRVKMWKTVYDKFPLYENKVTKKMVNEYWKTKPYNLEIPTILGNCTLCFNKGKNAIMAILTVYPELAKEWIADENKVNATYINGISMQQMLNQAQNNLFKDYHESLAEMKPAFDCACTN